MAYALKVTVTKPADVAWFAEIDPASHFRHMQWVNEYPGLITVTQRQIDANTVERIAVFESKEIADQFTADNNQHADFIKRNEYANAANNVSVIEEITL
jgi:recombinational DNA repair protein RecT